MALDRVTLFLFNWFHRLKKDFTDQAKKLGSKEDALKTISLNAAKAMGIEKTTGSLEVGKDATFFISVGDALDMKSNKVEQAFIQGRDINLDNWHKQLDKKFSDKYGIK